MFSSLLHQYLHLTMSRSGSGTNLNAAAADKKAEEINLILCEPDVDLWKLRELALTEGGLINGT